MMVNEIKRNKQKLQTPKVIFTQTMTPRGQTETRSAVRKDEKYFFAHFKKE